jgi:hypothetical protein
LITSAKDSAVRQESLTVPGRLASKQPHVVSNIVRDAVLAWLRTQDAHRSALTTVIEETNSSSSQAQKIGQLLHTIFSPAHKDERDVLAERAVDFLVPTHHPEMTEKAQISWISLVQGIGLDPADLLTERKEQVLKVLMDAAGAPPKVSMSALFTQMLRMLPFPGADDVEGCTVGRSGFPSDHDTFVCRSGSVCEHFS